MSQGHPAVCVARAVKLSAVQQGHDREEEEKKKAASAYIAEHFTCATNDVCKRWNNTVINVIFPVPDEERSFDLCCCSGLSAPAGRWSVWGLCLLSSHSTSVAFPWSIRVLPPVCSTSSGFVRSLLASS